MFSYNEDKYGIIMYCAFDGLNVLDDIDRKGKNYGKVTFGLIINYCMKQSRHTLHNLAGNQHLNQEHASSVHIFQEQSIKIVPHVNIPMAHSPKIADGR